MKFPDHKSESLSVHGAFSRLLPAVIALCFSALPTTVHAKGISGTSWWVLSGSANDFAAADIGQLKGFTEQAIDEMTYALPGGGAGTPLNNLLSGWINEYQTLGYSGTNLMPSDFQVANLGQLKYIANMVWSQLQFAGYEGTPSLPLPTWLSTLSSTANNMHAVNLGQLKSVFDFDLTTSSANNGIPDWWVNAYFPGSMVSGTFGVDPNAYVSWSGDQLTYLQAYQMGFNPLDYYNGQAPVLAIVSGTNQTGSPGGFVPAPLVVSVTDTSGNPLYDAPVTFTVTSGGGGIQASSVSGTTSALTVLADSNGQAQTYFQLPPLLTSTCTITVTAGLAQAVTFSAQSDNGTGQFASPFAPTNCIGTVNSDGSITLTWTDNTPNEIGIYVEYQGPGGGAWSPLIPAPGELPAGTTSVTIIPPGPGAYRIDPLTPTPGGGNTTNPSSPAFFLIPTQSYAAIDVSNGTVTSNVLAVALDDSNNVAFEYMPSSGSGPAVSTWANGSITSTYTAPFPFTVDDNIQDITFSATFPGNGYINTSGSIYGSIGCAEINSGLNVYEPLAICSSAGVNYIDPVFFDPFTDLATAAFEENNITRSAVSGCSQNGFFGSVHGNSPDYNFISQSGTNTVFSGSEGGNSYLEANATVIPQLFQATALSNNGWAIGYTGTNGDPGDHQTWQNIQAVVWPGSGSNFINLAPMETPIAINSVGQVVGETVGETGTTGYLWTSPNTISLCSLVTPGSPQSITTLLPPYYQNEVTNIAPIDISGTNSTDGSVRILFNANYQTDTQGDTASGTFVLTLQSGTTTALQQVSLSPNVNFSFSSGGDVMLNAQGIIAGTGTINGSDPPLAIPPVSFTGTDANPLVDTGAVAGTPSGFDGYTNPHWLTVPENGSNSAKANTPASPSFTAAFTGTTTDPYMLMTVSPSTTNRSPQTITANVGSTSGTYSSKIAVGAPGSVGVGGELYVDVKQYQLKTVAISAIAQQSGTNPIILATNAPTAPALQAYLNQVYGPQTNTYFYVQGFNYALNFDPTNTGTVSIDSTPGSTGGDETTAIRSVARKPSFDFNVYYVPGLVGPKNSTGWSFPDLYHDAFVGSNSGAATMLISAHELGHLFGLHHPQDPGAQQNLTAPPFDLMWHTVRGTFLDHLQWDIVNPFNPNHS